MNLFLALIGALAMISVPVFLILLAVNKLRKRPARQWRNWLIGSIAVLFVAIVAYDVPANSPSISQPKNSYSASAAEALQAFVESSAPISASPPSSIAPTSNIPALESSSIPSPTASSSSYSLQRSKLPEINIPAESRSAAAAPSASPPSSTVDTLEVDSAVPTSSPDTPEPSSSVPEVSISIEAPSETQTQTVLVTRTGSKYHTQKCGNGTYYEATLEDAISRGLTPCSKCY